MEPDKKIKNINEIINKMKLACVAFINAGVVPGVKTDSHNSTKKLIYNNSQCLYGNVNDFIVANEKIKWEKKIVKSLIITFTQPKFSRDI